MQDLNITLIQSELYWEEPSANLAMFEEKIWQITEPSDLIILPEMFNSGFTMNAQAVAEPMNLTTFKWMKQQAQQTGAVVTGSYIVKEKNAFFNRLIWMQPDGKYDVYDKKHLFRMAKENDIFTAGNNKIIKEIKGWKIMPLICYDLRFPVWSRNIDNAYDLLIYVANWPASRSLAWKALLQARAIENLSYVIGVNRIGEDGNSNRYSGDSMIYSHKGDIIFDTQDQPIIKTHTLSYSELDSFRKTFPAHLDADKFTIED